MKLRKQIAYREQALAEEATEAANEAIKEDHMQEDTRVRVLRGDHAGRVGIVRSASTESASWVLLDGDPPERQYRIAHEDLAVLPTSEALEQLVAAAKAAGAEGMWMVRGATDAHLVWDHKMLGDQAPSLVLTRPHELIVLIRIPTGDGEESGVEVRM